MSRSSSTRARVELGLLHPAHLALAEELIAAGYEKIGITGAPGTGKSSLSSALETLVPPGFLFLHTDDFLAPSASLGTEGAVAKYLMRRGSYVVEGVELPQMVELGLELDVLVWLRGKSTGREKKAKGLGAKVDSWALRYRGNKIESWR